MVFIDELDALGKKRMLKIGSNNARAPNPALSALDLPISGLFFEQSVFFGPVFIYPRVNHLFLLHFGASRARGDAVGARVRG